MTYTPGQDRLDSNLELRNQLRDSGNSELNVAYTYYGIMYINMLGCGSKEQNHAYNN